MTFSLAALCPRTGMMGVVVTSSSPAVAARCAHVRPKVGAACSQNITDPRLGGALLDLLEGGATAEAALDEVVAREPMVRFRQLSVVDAAGRVAAYSGEETLGTYATAEGEGVVACGNLLASQGVPEAMIAGFVAGTHLHLGDRMLAGLVAGLRAGGEAGPVHSVGMVIVADVLWPVVDLRVDWSTDPIADLARLWGRWKPQIGDYVTRALDPERSPSYGVPGDPGSSSR